ncbi:SDR family NAD(P)-dependent oxidoreductase [Leucobacter chinensis]|uniref:SDR family NAD(P)-dependent oxidoreductase n=1 Tax=Leucobacter chinensis TaxID=2851010 RepID=UPI001C23CD48
MKVALITGASGGIGASVSKTFSAKGYVIIAHYGSRTSKANEVARDIEASGGICYLVSSDLSTDTGVSDLIDRVKKILSENPTYHLSTLINNAAKLLSPSFAETEYSDFDSYIAVNTKAPFFLTQGLIENMSTGACIVNVSSASAHFSSPGDITYAISKAALESLTRNLAELLAPRGIRVNAVIPGFTDNGHPGFDKKPVLEYMSTFSVLGGVSEPETVADAIFFLASDKSKRTTGTFLDVSGGSILGARAGRKHSVKELL